MSVSVNSNNQKCGSKSAGGWLLMFVAAGLVLLPGRLQAQSSQLPQTGYYLGARTYYDADYKDAERYFSRGARTTFKFGTRKFLDSVCYWTMIGECYYHMGNYAQAVEMYEQSLQLYLTYQQESWQGRIQLPPTIQASNTAVTRSQINWATPSRTGLIANVPDTYQVLFGRLDADRVLQQGGVVQNAEMKQVDLNEIFRCLALCLHRRRVIKGPTAKLDPLSSQLVSGLGTAPIANGTIIGAYNGVLLGIAQATMEDHSAATRTLKSALQFGNRMDHPLTPVALLELAQLGVATDNHAVASQLALEAAFSAGVFNQFDLVAEALTLGADLHLRTSRTVYPPLVNAIGWAQRKDARLLQASMIVKLAECHAEAGDTVASINILRQTGNVIDRRSTLGAAVISARLKYVTALNQFGSADFDDGMQTLAAALKHFQTGSFWLYRLGLADTLVASNKINARQADQLYQLLLKDPQPADWELDPMEAIAFLATPHVGAMERWFEIVVARRDYRRALEIGEMIRRHRFFSTLPLGGRLMAFRWVMQAPDEALTDNAQKQRTSFLNRNAAYRTLMVRSKQMLDEVNALPLQPDAESDEARNQARLIKQLAEVSILEEAVLASNALGREPSDLVFPPSYPIKQIQTAIAPNQFALVSLATDSGYHLFLVGRGSVVYNQFVPTRNMIRAVGRWLKELGVTENVIEPEFLAEEDWKVTARGLANQFFPDTSGSDWDQFAELVVVPDGALWYVPFEALLVGEEDDEKLLSQRVNIRYSPTLGLAFGAQRPVREIEKTAVVLGRIHARVDDELVNTQFEELTNKLPEAKQLDRVAQSSNVLGATLDQLMVWSAIKPVRGSFYQFAPMQLGTERQEGTLSAWMQLPWVGPEHIILPAYHAEGLSLRGRPGTEMFLTTMGMMASGTRSILISRWNTGGKTALQLSGQYLEKMKPDGINKAIFDARQAIRESDLDVANEPRMKVDSDAPELKAEHPFFWASHMLLAIPDGTGLKVAPQQVAGESDDDQVGDDLPGDEKKDGDKGEDKEGGDEMKGEGDGKEGDGKEGDGKEAGAGEMKEGGKESTEKPKTGEKQGGGKEAGAEEAGGGEEGGV